MEKRINCGSPLFLPYHEATTKPSPENDDTFAFTHSHIILPGTVEDPGTQNRDAFYINNYKGEIQLMHDIADKQVEQLFDRELALGLGINWRFLTGREEVQTTLEQPIPEVERPVARIPVEGTYLDQPDGLQLVQDLDPDVADAMFEPPFDDNDDIFDEPGINFDDEEDDDFLDEPAIDFDYDDDE